MTLSKLAKLDGGKLEKTVQRQLGAVGTDIWNMPGVKKPRKVVIEFMFTPRDEDGMEVDFDFVVQAAKLPPRESKSYRVGNGANGQMEVDEKDLPIESGAGDAEE